MSFQPNNNKVTTNDWVPIRFSGIRQIEIVNTSTSGAAFLISTDQVNSYTIDPYTIHVWDLCNSDTFSYLYVKSAIDNVPATFRIGGW